MPVASRAEGTLAGFTASGTFEYGTNVVGLTARGVASSGAGAGAATLDTGTGAVDITITCAQYIQYPVFDSYRVRDVLATGIGEDGRHYGLWLEVAEQDIGYGYFVLAWQEVHYSVSEDPLQPCSPGELSPPYLNYGNGDLTIIDLA